MKIRFNYNKKIQMSKLELDFCMKMKDKIHRINKLMKYINNQKKSLQYLKIILNKRVIHIDIQMIIVQYKLDKIGK